MGGRDGARSAVPGPPPARVTVEVCGAGQMEARSSHGARLTMGGEPGPGGASGWQPVELLMAALGTCIAMDVRAILAKSRVTPQYGRVTVLGAGRADDSPGRPFLGFEVIHDWGDHIDPRVVERAIRLAAERYCTVQLTLELGPQVSHRLAGEATDAG